MRTTSKMILMAILSGLIILILACTSCKTAKSVSWNDNIQNPDNSEYVNECAFNLDIPAAKVTQKQFNERYIK